ncbi:8937_t:CDS:2 [Entrophospora sp. SA101]|nr:8937_t:CDS:2 [Entrophospora sp. SA101]
MTQEVNNKSNNVKRELETQNADTFIDREPDSKKIRLQGNQNRNNSSDLYLDTINRHMLDFDFEKVCSVSLSNLNVYACLVPVIAVPKHPIAAVVRGSLEYGLNMDVVQTRVLKFCYGIEVSSRWERTDPPERRTQTGRIFKFHKLAYRGTEVSVDQKYSYTAAPVVPNQVDMTFNIFISPDNGANYCDEDGMRMLGKMKIDLPDPQKGKNRLVEFSLTFSTMEIKAMAINKRTGQIYESNFVLEF